MMAGFDWLRLWHDMPNDPKWRTIARASGQPISLVVSTYLHILVDASQGVTLCHDMSRSVTRGVTDVTNEDIASALDCSEDAIQAIREAMQGRVLDGQVLLGWNKRQPKREDSGNPETGVKSSAQRKRDQRERERQEQMSRDVTQSHEVSRDVTLDKDKEEDKEVKEKADKPPLPAGFEEFWAEYPKKHGKQNAVKIWRSLKPDASLQAIIMNGLRVAKTSSQWQNGFIKDPERWLKEKRWEDETASAEKQSSNRWAGLR